MTNYRVGVDIGGTFTDIVFLGDDGAVLARKVASTPDDYSRGVLEGVRGGVAELGIQPAAVSEISHGFTSSKTRAPTQPLSPPRVSATSWSFAVTGSPGSTT